MLRNRRIPPALVTVLLMVFCGLCLFAERTHGTQDVKAAGTAQIQGPALVSAALVQLLENWGRPMYVSFVTAFYLGVQILATLATIVFVFVVLLQREEE